MLRVFNTDKLSKIKLLLLIDHIASWYSTLVWELTVAAENAVVLPWTAIATNFTRDVKQSVTLKSQNEIDLASFHVSFPVLYTLFFISSQSASRYTMTICFKKL